MEALLTQTTLATLHQREQTGLGQRLDMRLLNTIKLSSSSQVGLYLTGGEVPTPSGNEHRSIGPYSTLACGDGFVNVAVGNDALWRKFCLATDLAELGNDPRSRGVTVELPHATLGIITVTASPGISAGPVPRAPPSPGPAHG